MAGRGALTATVSRPCFYLTSFQLSALGLGDLEGELSDGLAPRMSRSRSFEAKVVAFTHRSAASCLCASRKQEISESSPQSDNRQD